MKKHNSNRKLVAEIAGWYGTVALITAYGLVSFKTIPADGIIFQLMNLTGALGIIVIAAYKKVRQSVVLNIFWGGIAIIALIQIIIGYS